MTHDELREAIARGIIQRECIAAEQALRIADLAMIRIAEALKEPTPKMQAHAWRAWHNRHGGKLGPGPAFTEALSAMLAASPLYPEK